MVSRRRPTHGGDRHASNILNQPRPGPMDSRGRDKKSHPRSHNPMGTKRLAVTRILARQEAPPTRAWARCPVGGLSTGRVGLLVAPSGTSCRAHHFINPWELNVLEDLSRDFLSRNLIEKANSSANSLRDKKSHSPDAQRCAMVPIWEPFTTYFWLAEGKQPSNLICRVR